MPSLVKKTNRFERNEPKAERKRQQNSQVSPLNFFLLHFGVWAEYKLFIQMKSSHTHTSTRNISYVIYDANRTRLFTIDRDRGRLSPSLQFSCYVIDCQITRRQVFAYACETQKPKPSVLYSKDNYDRLVLLTKIIFRFDTIHPVNPHPLFVSSRHS